MGRYTIRRLLQFIPVLLGTLFLLHYLQALSLQFGGNPVRAMFGDRQPPQETIDTLSRAFGLDDPCLESKFNPCFGMYFERLADYARGDFGTDFNGQATIDLIGRAAPITLRLTLLAILIEAIIGTDGSVREASVRRSIPLLDQAALDAVRQWRYEPTLLNGVPVEVIMTTTVGFSLPQ